jgi:hypothetical protein
MEAVIGAVVVIVLALFIWGLVRMYNDLGFAGAVVFTLLFALVVGLYVAHYKSA